MLSLAHSRQIWKTAFLPILDLSNLLLAAALAYWIRYDLLESTFNPVKRIFGQQYVWLSCIVAIAIIAIWIIMGVYRVFNKPTLWQIILNTNIGVWLAMLGSITYLYFNEYIRASFETGGFDVSRFILGVVGFLAIGTVLLGRLAAWYFEKLFYIFWPRARTQIALIGKQNLDLISELSRREDISRIHSFTKLSTDSFTQLQDLIFAGNLSEIYLCSLNDSELESELALLAERHKIRFVFSPQGYEILKAFKVRPLRIRGMYFFEMYYSALEGWPVVGKRVFDLLISLSFILIFGWLYLLLALAIKLDSPGNVFYSSERVGPNGQVFKMFKFRRFKSEYCTSELDPKAKKALEYEQELIKKGGKEADRGALYKIKDDPRMTRVGKFLEQTSLDEIPQFFNVVLGSLSLVGPRAHQPREVKKYTKSQYKVLNIKPGITGYAQINGRSDLSFEREVQYDTWYVENWNFWLDVIILIKTPLIILFKRHGN
ncbi:MAG: exopolysaccharide biosynthesis polyprenyl glycosylphosphotransferase [Candidatus Parcubacteria bacterium]|nr:exopolysaccharide biosynthesis polyprenyl glycosylphosphotransferase [Candidatus Paceibacterota bacterium]